MQDAFVLVVEKSRAFNYKNVHIWCYCCCCDVKKLDWDVYISIRTVNCLFQVLVKESRDWIWTGGLFQAASAIYVSIDVNRLRNLTLPLSLSLSLKMECVRLMYTNFGCLKIDWSTIFVQYCVCSGSQKRHLSSSCCDAVLVWQRKPFDIKCQIFKLLQMDVKKCHMGSWYKTIYDSSLSPLIASLVNLQHR